MKFWVLILVLAITAQPLQAGGCPAEMEKSPETAHQMDHPGMDHPGQDSHDCCDPDDSDVSSGCGGNMNCSPCFVSVPIIPNPTRISAIITQQHTPGLSSGVVLPSHTTPPFRPPIS